MVDKSRLASLCDSRCRRSFHSSDARIGLSEETGQSPDRTREFRNCVRCDGDSRVALTTRAPRKDSSMPIEDPTRNANRKAAMACHRQAGKPVGVTVAECSHSGQFKRRPRFSTAEPPGGRAGLRAILSLDGTGCRRERRAIAFLGRHNAGQRSRCSGVGSDAGPICAFGSAGGAPACEFSCRRTDQIGTATRGMRTYGRSIAVGQRLVRSGNVGSANTDESWPKRGKAPPNG
jgi:hypothetical protein